MKIKRIPHDDADDDEYYEMYYTEEEPEVSSDPHNKYPAEQDNWL
ncbi:MAG: hypothetical protein WC279_14085 [Sulfurimonas sp.]|jgi:hypothetical protein